MKKYICTKCNKEYDVKPEKCECGNIEFVEKEVVIENNMNDKVLKNENEILKKQIETMQKQIQMIQENAEQEKLRAEKEKEELKMHGMSEAEKLEFKRQKELKEANEQTNKVLTEYDKVKKELEKERAEKETVAKEKAIADFKIQKLLLAIEKPYLKSKLDLCETKADFDAMMKFVNEDEEKAKYEADNNMAGSVLNLTGTIPINKVKKPSTIGEQLEQRKQKRLEELKEKQNRRR